MLPDEENSMSWDKKEVLDTSRTPEYTVRIDTLDVHFVQFVLELKSVGQKHICMHTIQLSKDLELLFFRSSLTILVLI